jgi:hypothetical protein
MTSGTKEIAIEQWRQDVAKVIAIDRANPRPSHLEQPHSEKATKGHNAPTMLSHTLIVISRYVWGTYIPRVH